MDNPDVKIFSVMYDEYQPYSCLAWVAAGTAEMPILVYDGDAGVDEDMELLSLFFDYSGAMPNSVFLNHELKVHYKHEGGGNPLPAPDIIGIINEMLDEMKEGK